MKIDVHTTEIIFKRNLTEDYPKLSARQINKMMVKKGYKLYSINTLPNYVKEYFDLKGLHGKVKVFVKLP